MARHKPDFSLWLGDAIYTDIPRGWLEFGGGFGTNDKLYEHEYQALRSEVNARRFWASTPTYFAFDDHEVYNDLGGRESDPEVFDAALRNWDRFLASVNPARLVPGGSRQYTFRAGAASFFVLDVRHHRACTGGTGRVLGAEQLEQLKNWLLAEAASSPFLIIVSPVGVSRNRPEAWEGWNCAPAERQDLLSFIVSRRLTNVLFISGDTHNPVRALRCRCSRTRFPLTACWLFLPNSVILLPDCLPDCLPTCIHSHSLASLSRSLTRPQSRESRASQAVFELEPGVFEVAASPLDAFGHGVWGGTADRTLYEGAGMTTVFAKFQLSHERLRVELYGAGYPLGMQVGAILGIFTLLAIAAEGSSSFAQAFDVAPFAILVAAAAVLVAATVYIDDLERHPSFLRPRFVFELLSGR
jgi:hypothetical protein